jgi:membrane associated rhomboid family serine protease
MKRTLPITLGILMFVIGAVWTFQGLGYLEGSPMTGVALWAIVGPLVAGLGVGFVLAGLRRRERQ